MEDGDDGEGEEEKIDVLRVFCWGGIVGHVWLMLWVGSERKIRSRLRSGEGSRWLDAKGEVVVEMG